MILHWIQKDITVIKKTSATLIALLLLAPFQLSAIGWEEMVAKLPAWLQRGPTPIFGLVAISSATTAGVIKTIEWWRNKEQSVEELKKQILAVTEELNSFQTTLSPIISDTTKTTEMKLQSIAELPLIKKPTEIIKDSISYKKVIASLLITLTTLKSQAKTEKDISEIKKLSDDINQLMNQLTKILEFLITNERFFTVKDSLEKIEKIANDPRSSAFKLKDAFIECENYLPHLTQYPHLQQRTKELHRQLIEAYNHKDLEERKEQVRSLEQDIAKKFRNFTYELSQSPNQLLISQWVDSYQLKYPSKYRYIQYAEGLSSTITSIEEIIHTIKKLNTPFDTSLEHSLNQLKTVHKFITNNQQFVQRYNEELEIKRRDTLEKERLEILRQQIEQEERARQEKLELERRSVRLLEEKVRAEEERVRQIKKQVEAEKQRKEEERKRIELEKQRKAACEKSAEEERKRREAELKKAKAIEEQNRIEREKLAKQSYKPQLYPSSKPTPTNYAPSAPPMDFDPSNPYANASAPPMD